VLARGAALTQSAALTRVAPALSAESAPDLVPLLDEMDDLPSDMMTAGETSARAIPNATSSVPAVGNARGSDAEHAGRDVRRNGRAIPCSRRYPVAYDSQMNHLIPWQRYETAAYHK
jgi:hypothetical protein